MTDIFKLRNSNSYVDKLTTQKYWDCECDEDYIKRATVPKCEKCGAIREDQPCSRIAEVEDMLAEKISGFLWECRIALGHAYFETGDREYMNMRKAADVLIADMGGLK